MHVLTLQTTAKLLVYRIHWVNKQPGTITNMSACQRQFMNRKVYRTFFFLKSVSTTATNSDYA